jgi:hypothetical protein
MLHSVDAASFVDRGYLAFNPSVPDNRRSATACHEVSTDDGERIYREISRIRNEN